MVMIYIVDGTGDFSDSDYAVSMAGKLLQQNLLPEQNFRQLLAGARHGFSREENNGNSDQRMRCGDAQ
jgi:hypothetical protein